MCWNVNGRLRGRAMATAEVVLKEMFVCVDNRATVLSWWCRWNIILTLRIGFNMDKVELDHIIPQLRLDSESHAC